MGNWFSELWLFIVAVFTHWQALVTGGIVIAAVGFYEHKKRQLSWESYAFIAGIFLLYSVFAAWQDEHHSALSQAAKLETLTMPKLEPHIDQFLTTRVGEIGQDTLVTFTTTVINKGAPSMIGKVHAYLELPNGQIVQGQYISPPEDGIKIRLGLGSTDREIVFQGKDYLPTKGLSAIPTGSAVQGYYQAVFSVPMDTVEQGNVYLHIAFIDVNGRSYDGRTSMHGDSELPPDIRHLQDFMKGKK